MTLFSRLGVVSVMAAPSLAGLVAFSHLQVSQIRGRQPYSIVRNILYVILAFVRPWAGAAQRVTPIGLELLYRRHLAVPSYSVLADPDGRSTLVEVFASSPSSIDRTALVARGLD